MVPEEESLTKELDSDIMGLRRSFGSVSTPLWLIISIDALISDCS